MIVLRTLKCVLNRRSSLCAKTYDSCGLAQRCRFVISIQKRSKASSASEISNEKATDDEDEKTKRAKAATDKLNSLLSSLQVDESSVESTSSAMGNLRLKLNLAKPSTKIKDKAKEKLAEQREALKMEKQEVNQDGIDGELAAAAKIVATSFGGDVETTESELLQKLKQHSQSGRNNDATISSDLFEGMKIETVKIDKFVERSGEFGRAGMVRKQLGIQDAEEKISPNTVLKYQALHRQRSEINIFGSGSLNIFTKQKEKRGEEPEFPELKTWDELDEENLQSLVSHPPKNGFEEMIVWTKQNKVWKFPIDNEQGLNEEAEVGFHEHVFLEHLLEDGFPKKGPVRHYMELVTTGLSKNPYMTVKEKHAHIDWYREYFQTKIETLKELGIHE